jgi:hypothetical protein
VKVYLKPLSYYEKYPEIAIQWRNAWTLHVEGFHEISLSEKEITKLKEDVRKLVVIASNTSSTKNSTYPLKLEKPINQVEDFPTKLLSTTL